MAAPAIRAMDTVTVAATAAAMAEVEGTAVEAAAGIVSRGAAADASAVACRLGLVGGDLLHRMGSNCSTGRR